MTDSDAKGWAHRILCDEEDGAGYAVFASPKRNDSGDVWSLRFQVRSWVRQQAGSAWYGTYSGASAEGRLKADGCIDYDGCDAMMHACGLADFQAQCRAIEQVYALGKEYGFDVD